MAKNTPITPIFDGRSAPGGRKAPFPGRFISAGLLFSAQIETGEISDAYVTDGAKGIRNRGS
jgi:hypothetical protein